MAISEGEPGRGLIRRDGVIQTIPAHELAVHANFHQRSFQRFDTQVLDGRKSATFFQLGSTYFDDDRSAVGVAHSDRAGSRVEDCQFPRSYGCDSKRVFGGCVYG